MFDTEGIEEHLWGKYGNKFDAIRRVIKLAKEFVQAYPSERPVGSYNHVVDNVVLVFYTQAVNNLMGG
ncbi:hypothetical protein P4479_08420 [Brevibacillus agri]|uniref:hypothetical protein n=1 Tax=Brevibacillus agri TaxID=51101 RepID=UPI0002A50667|nr:hypothetical protein [Brevibacillus agri]ELK39270.1 hypothetical protein D478_25358 [Brevibacillus agri BAB-2500]MED3498482.1 hypothetical protein [Brevibacillus agri]